MVAGYRYAHSAEYYLNNIDYLVSRLKDVQHESCKRHYAHILFGLTCKNAPLAIQQKFKDLDLEDVVEKLFDWLIDPKVKVAVKVFAADTLCHLSDRYD